MATKKKPAVLVEQPVDTPASDFITKREARELIADALNECGQEARGYFGASAIVQALTTVAKRFRGGK